MYSDETTITIVVRALGFIYILVHLYVKNNIVIKIHSREVHS